MYEKIDFKNNLRDEELTDLNMGLSDLYDEPKFMKYFYQGSLLFSASMFIAAIMMAFGIPLWTGFFISLPTVGPLSLFGMKKLKEKSDRDFAADMQMSQQLVKMLNEAYEVDHKITPTSACFYHEIEGKPVLSDANSNAVNNISQLLCMINANYYEEINANLTKELSRDELIDKVLDQIVIYVSKYGLASFSITQAKDIINGCIFISDATKKKLSKNISKLKSILVVGKYIVFLIRI